MRNHYEEQARCKSLTETPLHLGVKMTRARSICANEFRICAGLSLLRFVREMPKYIMHACILFLMIASFTFILPFVSLFYFHSKYNNVNFV